MGGIGQELVFELIGLAQATVEGPFATKLPLLYLHKGSDTADQREGIQRVGPPGLPRRRQHFDVE